MDAVPAFDGFAALAGMMIAMGVISLFLYVFFAVVLTVLAVRTRTPGAIMAWIPLLNMYLLCKIGRRSGAWILALFIPIVNIFVFAMLWASVAAARGKSSWLGPLMLIPPFTLLVPLILMFGKGRDDQAAAARGGTCGHCHSPIGGYERFCRRCGAPLPAATMPVLSGPTAASGVSLGGVMAVSLLVLLVLGIGTAGAGWYFLFKRDVAYTPPARQDPAIPQVLAGTMREFPVDTDPTSPVTPDSVMVQDFRNQPAGNTDNSLSVPDAWLPPGVDRSAVPKDNDAMSSAVYNTNLEQSLPLPPASGSTPPSVESTGGGNSIDNSVYVHVLQTRSNAPQEQAQLTGSISQALGTKPTGIQVQSPTGQVYNGSRIRTAQQTVYVLTRQSSSTVIIVYAPQPSGAAIADRLTRNIGNGSAQSLNPGVRGPFGVLPAAPVEDLRMYGVNTITPRQMGITRQALADAGKSANDPRVQQQLAMIQNFLPQRLTYAAYTDSQGAPWGSVVVDFGGVRTAGNLWMLFDWTVGRYGFKTAPMAGGDARYMQEDKENARLMFFHRGPYIVLIFGPATAPVGKFVNLGAAHQM